MDLLWGFFLSFVCYVLCASVSMCFGKADLLALVCGV